MNLFSEENKRESIQFSLPDANISYYPSFFSSEEATRYFKIISEETPWQQDTIKIFGKVYDQPRLTRLYGSINKSYSYSGITMNPLPFTKTLLDIKSEIEIVSEEKFNTVLLNLYRSGSDSNGWHSDDEKELGANPFIASVTFGAKRTFHLRHKQDKHLKHKIVLEHGSLLLMGGATQSFWQHQIPKSKRVIQPRINLTFRLLV